MTQPLPTKKPHIALLLTAVLLCWGSIVQAATYFSYKAAAPFEINYSSLSNWNTQPDGTGVNPVAADLTNGLHVFIVQNGYTVTLNQNGAVNTLTVGTGAGANFVFGNDATARTFTIGAGGLNIAAGSSVTVSAFNATHTLTQNGQMALNGTLDLRNTSAQVVNTNMGGTYSITGTGTIEFNSITFTSGTVTAARALTARGNVTVNSGATFVGGAHTHTVFGNWAVSGTYTSTGSTVEFANTLIQTITTAATFNNVSFIGGGTVSVSGALTVNGNLSVTSTTTLTTTTTQTLNGNFTVAPTATFTATGGTITFSGTAAQTIDLSGSVTFNALVFSNGGVSNPKNIIGNLNVNNTITINGAPTAAHLTGSGNHTFRNTITFNGTANFTGTITLTTVTLQNTLASAIDFGAAAFTITGTVTVSTGDNWTVGNSVTVNTGASIVLNNTSSLNDGSGTGTLILLGTANLYVRGTNNFPTGFATYNLANTSSVRYDGALAQTVRGITYGNLVLQTNTKTVDGGLTINGNIDLNGAATLDLGNFSHFFRGTTIVNSVTRNGSITSASGGTFTFDGADINQTINTPGTGTYTFHNLVFQQTTTPTAVRTRTFQGNAVVNGDLTITNAAGDVVNQLVVALGNFTLTKGAPSGTLTLGANAVISTAATNNFALTTNSFSTVALDVSSIIRFLGTNQDIPALTYGNIEHSGNGNKAALGALDINGNFVRTGGNSLFVGGAFTHTVAGNWNINSTTLFNATGTTIVFDGASQSVFTSNFSDVQFAGTGTKTLAGNLVITGNATTTGSITIDANTRQITLSGNWSNTGGSVFTHTTGSLIVAGNSASAQTLTTTAASAFGSITLQRPNTSTNRVFRILTNVQVLGAFTFSSGSSTNLNELDLNGLNLFVGGNFTFQGSSVFTANNGTLTLNGSSNQTLQNTTAGANYYDVVFTGGGTKTIGGTTLNVTRNFNISGPTVTTGVNINVQGDWINTGVFVGTGGNTVTFNGSGPQAIGASNFLNVTFSAAGVKTLTGNITAAGNFILNSPATLDVSTNDYSITCDNNFTIAAGGIFVPRNGAVTFTGTGTINTGTLSTDREFYDLVISVGSGNTTTAGSALRVRNDVSVNSGTLAIVNNNLTVGGSFTNASIFNAVVGILTMNATSGVKTLTTGGSSMGPVTINAPGATIQLGDNLTLASTRAFTMTAGTFDLEGKAMNMAGALNMAGGTFHIDAGAVLRMSNTNAISVTGGNFMVVGTPSLVANLTINGTGNYTFSMNNGTFHANYYNITNTSGNGIVLSGSATIDATNNLSNGTFSGATGTSYLTLTGINFTSYTASNIVFNAGPTSNITRSSGTGKLTISDALGARAGNAFRGVGTTNAFVEFITPPGAVTWDGGASTNSWNDALNWSNDIVPTAATLVYLDHTNVAATYTVNLTGTAGVAARVVLDAGGGNPISLVLNGTTLAVSGSVVVGTGTTLTQTNPGDAISLTGNWLVTGTFNEGTSTVTFNGTSGTSTITTGGVSDPFHNLTINASGATYVLGSALAISGNYTQSNGTLDVSVFNINAAGNWTYSGGSFIPRAATVELNGTGAQAISGGLFNNLTTSSTVAGSTKTITTGMTVRGNMVIGTNTIVAGGVQIINVGGNWTNNVGVSGFTQSGTGAVFFNGANQSIVSASTTTFRNVYFSGTGNVTINSSVNVNGDMSILAGVNQVDLNFPSLITGTGTGTFSMNGSTFRVFHVFPGSFGTYALNAGTVSYFSNLSQTVAAVTYNNLSVSRSTSGTPTKTAAGNVSVNGVLTIGDAFTTLAMGANTLTVTGNYVHTAGAPQITWSGAGTFVHNGANFTISPNVTSFNNLTLAGSGTKTMGGNLNIAGDVVVNPGVTLTMGAFTMTGTASKAFTLNGGSTLNCGILAPTAAIPTGFGTYSMAGTSNYVLNGTAAQTISSLATYGAFNIATSGGAATLNGNTEFTGDFTMTGGTPTLADGGFNMTFGGSSVSLRNYTPSVGTTVTFNGSNQSIVNASPGAPEITLHNVVFANSGTKSSVTSDLIVNGNMTIDAGVTFSSDEEVTLAGNLTNNGTLTHSANTFNFTGTSAQALNPGAANSFFGVRFTGAGTKTFNTNGMVVGNGIFNIDNTTVDLGALTHSIASSAVTFDGTGTWTTTNTNLTFNRLGAQAIPGFTANNVVFSGNNTKTLSAPISVNDITINNPVTLDVDATDDWTVTVRGNFNNTSATFLPRNGLVAFESPDAVAKTITNATFYNVTFNQALTGSRTYTITANTAIQSDLTLGNGATFNLNGRVLTMGSASAASVVSVSSGATLDVNANAQLLFNCTAGDATLTSAGTFRLVGTTGNVATLSRSAGTGRIGVNITSGTIHARDYQIQSLTDNGLDIAAAATVDNTNNFSDGTFSGINTANTGGPFRYLNFNSASTPTTVIDNVTFNHGGTPTIGVSYNVARAGSASLITFGSNVAGLLAGSTYEDDPGSKIDWPVITSSTWTGAVSTDWFTAGNWSTGAVPTSTTNVTIPLVANNPEISAPGAITRALTITNGLLQLLGGYDLTVSNNITIGTGTSSANLVVETATSNIFVAGAWTRGTNGSYAANGSTVNFNGTSGTYTITPLTSAFGNLTISGAATYLLSGTAITVNGNVLQSAGVLNPNTTNYVLTVLGNWTRSAGTFSNATAGTVVLSGAAQTVTGGTFNALSVSGTSTKSTSGAVTVGGALTVNSTLAANAGSTIAMQGNVTISGSGTFNGGTSTHTFSGLSWTGTGAYTASGSTINFNRVGGTQTINASKFDNLLFSGTSAIVLAGATDVSGDVTFNSTVTSVNFGVHQLTRLSGPAGTFTVLGSVPMTVTGANNFPNGFATYDLSATSVTTYSGTSNQTIRGIAYGNLTLTNANTKTLEGPTTVQGNLTFNTATLDVSASNHDLVVNGNFANNSTGSFICRAGTVTMNGSAAQTINLSINGTKTFNRLLINNTGSATVALGGAGVTVQNNLEVASGNFSAGGQTLTLNGDLIAYGTGGFINSGTIVMNKATGTALLQMNGTGVGRLDLAGGIGTTFQAQDNLRINGNFNVNSGTFNAHGYDVTMGGGTTALNVNSTYTMGTGGTLIMANGVTVTVGAAGTFNAIGTASDIVRFTRLASGNTYSFNVNGTLAARHYLFEWMSASGISIGSTGIISTANNLSDGTFTNGASGGTLLRIENTQNLTGANRIENVKFTTNPGGGARNVTKTSSTSGTVEFYNATGVFSGPTFENDPNGLINWTGPIILTWNGSVSSDWNTAANWTPSSGPAIVPNSTTDVVIAVSSNNPTISGVDAQAANMVVNAGAVLSITSSTNTNVDLTVFNNLDLLGFMIMSTSDDKLEIRGNYVRAGSGTFTPGQGIVEMATTSGTKLFNNGTTAVWDLIISGTGLVQLGANTTVSNNLTIQSGGSLDNSTSNFNLTVGGSLVNNGTWVPRNSLLTLNSSSVSRNFTPGAGTTLYDITFSAGSGSVVYTLGSALSMTRNLNLNQGRLDLNGNTFTFGNNTGTPALSISGILEVDANAILRMGTGSSIAVNSGGRLILLGTSSSAVATLTRTVGGTNYAVNVNSGATLEAQYYLVEFTNVDGIYVRTGATLDATNTLQNGTFSNGASGGRYLRFDNNFAADRTITNVVFNAGPTRNAFRTTGTNNVIFEDATGPLSGFTFEQDELAQSATAGRIRWNYTYSLVTWNGSQTGGFWSDPLNWTPNTVPTSSIGVTIPNVGNSPVIDADAQALNLTVNSGATLTLTSDADLVIGGFLNNAGTITVSGSSNSLLNVGGAYTNTGTFNPGTASTVTFNAASGTVNINNASSSFRNVTFNSSGSANFTTSGSITVLGDLTLTAGTLTVSNAAHNINIAGSWTHTGGTFVNGSATVTFNGTGAGTQSVSSVSGAAFHNLTFTGNRTKQLSSNITVNNNLVISSGSNLNAGSATINLARNFTATGATFTAGTSTLALVGTASQTITRTGGITLYSLTVNNSSSTFPQVSLSGGVTLASGGTLTLTNGRVATTVSSVLTLSSGVTLAGGSTNSYISGPLRRSGATDFTYPLGKGTIYAPLGMESLSGTSTFINEYFDNRAPVNLYLVSAPLQRISNIEYWDITRESGSASALVRLFWNNGTRSRIGTGISALRVAHWNGSTWESFGGTATGSVAAGNVVSTSPLSSFSPVTLGSENAAENPLPVVFSTIKATEVAEGAQVSWTTSQEKDADYYEVEYSRDAQTWERVGFVDAAGNTSTTTAYSFLHDDKTQGVRYYRLKQVDNNGFNFDYSPVVQLLVGKKNNLTLAVKPNPVSTYGKLTYSVAGLAEGELASLTITNTLGQAVYATSVNGVAAGIVNQEIDLPSNMGQGIYLLNVQYAGKSFTTRVVVE